MPESGNTSTTLLLDGLWGNPSRLGLMRKRLIAAGVGQVETFAYRSSGFSCLKTEGNRLAERIAEIDGSVNLVGYSMGGLVIRSALCETPSTTVRRVAFINTPHAGSLLARWMPGVGIGQMRPGCEFLKALESGDWPYETFSMWTPGDLMVVPAVSARWSKARQIATCRVPAHVWPLVCRDTHRQIAEFFLSPS